MPLNHQVEIDLKIIVFKLAFHEEGSGNKHGRAEIITSVESKATRISVIKNP